MQPPANYACVVRYKGFVLLEQPNHSWLIRPERSPMFVLPFRTIRCSLREAKELLEQKLAEEGLIKSVA